MSHFVAQNQITPEGRSLIQAYQKMTHETCAPIFWGDGDSRVVEDQGTVTFLKLEGKTIGITAGHVAEGLYRFVKNGGTACRVGNANFFPPKQLVFHPKFPEIDLALFDAGHGFTELVGIRPLSLSDWPPRKLGDRQITLLGGFPGVFRVERNETIDFEFFFYVGRVDGVVNEKVRIILNITESNALAREDVTPGFKLGGMSGGPVFRHVDCNLVERIELAGIISEGISDYEVFYATNISSLTRNGDFDIMASQ